MKDKNRSFLSQAVEVMRNEIEGIVKDLGVIIFLFILPLAYPLIYALIYGPETAHEIPIAVVDDSRTASSREFLGMLDATSQVSIASYSADMQEARRLADARNIFGILSLDRDFEENIMSGKQSVTSLFIDMSSLLYYREILTATTNVNMAFNEDIQRSAMGEATVKQISMALNPVKSSSIAIYNPTSGFAIFIVPGIEVLIIQQALLLGVSVLAGTVYQERKRRKLKGEDIRHNHYSPLSEVMGKAVAYILAASASTVWAVGCMPMLLDYISLGDIITSVVFLTPFICGSVFLAIALSTLFKSREIPMLVFIFMSIPLLFLSGISWPWDSISSFWKGIASIFPSTFAIQGIVYIKSCGASLSQVEPLFIKLWIQCIVYFVLAWGAFKLKARKRQKSMSVDKSEL